MIEPMTLARPYARAAFDYARQAEQLDPWLSALSTLAASASDPRVTRMLKDPAMTGEARADAFCGLLGDSAPSGMNAFLHVMAENGRLDLLPEVAELLGDLKAALEATVEVEVTSAMDVSDEELQQLTAAMTERLERTVSISTLTDPSLIGGAVIRAGDLVIDGSVRGRLRKLAGALTP